MSRTLRAWAIGLLAGLVAALVAVLVAVQVHPGTASSDDASHAGRPGDRVQHAIDGLRRDHFYVGPELRDRLTDAQFDAIADAAKHAVVPTYVVWWGDVGDDIGFGSVSDLEADEQIMAAIGQKGYYAVITEAGYGVQLEALGYESPFVDGDLAQGRPDVALLRYVKALAKERPRPVVERGSSDYWGGPGGGFAAAALMVVPSFFALMLLVWLAGVLTRPLRRRA